jgi:hypothetical protein
MYYQNIYQVTRLMLSLKSVPRYSGEIGVKNLNIYSVTGIMLSLKPIPKDSG